VRVPRVRPLEACLKLVPTAAQQGVAADVLMLSSHEAW